MVPDQRGRGLRRRASSVGEASSGRWTRSRGRLLAAENTGPAQSVEDSRGDRRRAEGFSARKKREAAGSERVLSAEEVALAARPLPPHAPFPKSGQHDDVVAWSEDLMKLGDEDTSLLTLRAVRGTKSVKSAMSLDDRDMILDVACSVVNVSATEPDGNVVVYCTGIITEYDEVGKCAKILSSSSIM
ncbi:uncharacterized protein [Triticum aestivum]|uniref:uncharacterized protein n=1 Tax=Triticum aestivum TaxID=4565 RepID=UPI001D02A2DD|nr:uncharacterized protein LOC123048961 [Triticum aestivum]